jgi:hypothetical protein
MPNICDLVCPEEGQEVIKNPNQKLGSGSFTCRELVLSTWYMIPPSCEPCVKVLTGYTDKGFINECCGVPTA